MLANQHVCIISIVHRRAHFIYLIYATQNVLSNLRRRALSAVTIRNLLWWFSQKFNPKAQSRESIFCSLSSHQHTLLTENCIIRENILLGKLYPRAATLGRHYFCLNQNLCRFFPEWEFLHLNKHTWWVCKRFRTKTSAREDLRRITVSFIMPGFAVREMLERVWEDTCVGGVFLLRNLTGSHTQSRHFVRPTPHCGSGIFCICVACAHNVTLTSLSHAVKICRETMGAVKGTNKKLKRVFGPKQKGNSIFEAVRNADISKWWWVYGDVRAALTVFRTCSEN